MGHEIRFVDTTLRDGQQSLWALRMRTAMMLPTLPDLDAAGYDGIEFTIAIAQFARQVRDLNEDPWDWFRLGLDRIEKTMLRPGTVNARFQQVPRCVQTLFLEKLAEMGLSMTRASNPWNDYDALAHDLAFYADHGVTKIVVNLIYTVSPRHTSAYYVQKVRDALKLKPWRICFKDVGGLLTPEAAHDILPLVVEAAGNVDMEFHSHCQSGFAPYCALIAAEAGITVIHTAIPPLANGTSQPSIFDVANNLEARGFVPAIDVVPLRRVSEHLLQIARDEGLPEGSPRQYDERLYRHQVPGGMISNLQFHLDQAGLADRIDSVLDETARVREEFGYPIMITPLAQFVATQAALNVIGGERYKVVSDDVIKYALGGWGREAIEFMDRDVRDMILAQPRAKSVQAAMQQAKEEPSLREIRQRFGKGITDEEIIVRFYSGVGEGDLQLDQCDEVAWSYDQYRALRRPLYAMLRDFERAGSVTRMSYRSGGLSVRMKKLSGKAPVREC